MENTNTRPVDCHCHIEFDRFDDDRNNVIRNAEEKLEFIVSVGCNFERNRKTLEIYKDHEDFVIPNLGLHPTFTEDFDRLEDIKRQIRENDPAAIGEIGLDHHHITEDEMRERQREVFKDMLSLAEEMSKPVNVHSREAEQEVINILKEYNLPDILIHCFNGTPDQATEAVQEGFTIGITTQVLYSNRVQSIVKTLDLDDIVLETDSPFLYQGERNEPINVIESAEKIAELKDVPKDKVIDHTTSNAKQIFDEG